MPISYKMLPLSDLFEHIHDEKLNVTDAKKKFFAAMDAYCVKLNCKPPTPDHPKPPPAKVEVNKSQALGGSGGSPFEWEHPHPTLGAKKFIMRSGSEIDNIQIFLSDGVTNMYSPQHGGGGGNPGEWTVPDN